MDIKRERVSCQCPVLAQAPKTFQSHESSWEHWENEKKNCWIPLYWLVHLGTHRSHEKLYNKGQIGIDEDNSIPYRNHPSICFWRMFLHPQNHPFNLPPCRTMVQDITSGCSCQTKPFCKSISVMRHCLPSPASPGRRIRMGKGPPIDKFIIYTCVYICIYFVYIHYMYAYIVLVDPFLGFTNFEPAICLAGWSRIASIKPLNKPRPVLHSLRKNSEKNTCLCTTTFFTPMLPLHSAVIYIAMETVQTFALLFQISQRRYDEVRFFGSQNPSNLEPRHLAVLQIGIECNNLSLDAVLIIFLIHTGYL